MKLCTKCDRELPLELFPKNKRRADGLNNYCKACKKLRDSQYVYAPRDPKKVSEYARKDYAKHKEARRATQKLYYQNNKEKYREYGKARYEDPTIRARILANRAAYYARNKKSCYEQSLAYNAAHPEKIREHARNSARRGRESLSDTYIKQITINATRSARVLSFQDIPIEFVKLKRELIILKRSIREKRTGT